MLEHVPSWLGNLLHNVRAGHEKLVVAQPGIALADPRIDLSSPAFGNHTRLPVRFTADGEGISPPLIWSEVPAGTQSLALIVEDPDAPALSPLVHAIVWQIPATERMLPEGAIQAARENDQIGQQLGRNSYFAEGWLPPDPPTGHGDHDYVFQLFALDNSPDISANPGRSDFIEAINEHVLGTGLLVGTYSRGQTAHASDDATLSAALAGELSSAR